MRIVVASDSFKEALAAAEVCAAIGRGVQRACPEATMDLVPMADGGEGTVDALVAATGGEIHRSLVHGPLGDRVPARWGILGTDERVAAIEMAEASGLALVPLDDRDPTRTTTQGTGELVRAALDAGATSIILGIGGSATCDGGTGAAQAIGVQFRDQMDAVLGHGLTGGELDRIAHIDLSPREPRIEHVRIQAACDVDNPLCGPRGAAAIYGPQKGATPEQVRQLDANLGHLEEVIRRDLGRDVATLPGAGAAGGLGAGLVAFFDATLEPGIDLVMSACHLPDRIAGADLVITGEGRLDGQSMMGKVIAGVGRTARNANVPIIALAGSLGDGVEATREVLDAYYAINPPNLPLEEALARTARALEETAAKVVGDHL